MKTSTNHLSAEQLYDLLDQPDQTTGTHIHVCGQCRQELAALRSSLADLRVATTAFAAAQPLRLHTPPQRAPFAGIRLQVFAASCATALVVITTSVSLLAPHRRPAPAPAAVSVFTSESDDALLNGVAQDLSASVPPSLAPLQVAAPISVNHGN